MPRYTLKHIFLWVTIIGLALGLYNLDRSLPERIRWIVPEIAILVLGILLTATGLILRAQGAKRRR